VLSGNKTQSNSVIFSYSVETQILDSDAFVNGYSWPMREGGTRLNLVCNMIFFGLCSRSCWQFEKWKPFSVDELQEYCNCITVSNEAFDFLILECYTTLASKSKHNKSAALEDEFETGALEEI